MQNLMQIRCSTHSAILNAMVKSSLFLHVHSSPLSLAARLHRRHANRPCYTESDRTNACLNVVGRVIIAVITYSFNLHISPKTSYGVLECDTVMLHNYIFMIL